MQGRVLQHRLSVSGCVLVLWGELLLTTLHSSCPALKAALGCVVFSRSPEENLTAVHARSHQPAAALVHAARGNPAQQISASQPAREPGLNQQHFCLLRKGCDDGVRRDRAAQSHPAGAGTSEFGDRTSRRLQPDPCAQQLPVRPVSTNSSNPFFNPLVFPVFAPSCGDGCIFICSGRDVRTYRWMALSLPAKATWPHLASSKRALMQHRKSSPPEISF